MTTLQWIAFEWQHLLSEYEIIRICSEGVVIFDLSPVSTLAMQISELPSSLNAIHWESELKLRRLTTLSSPERVCKQTHSSVSMSDMPASVPPVASIL